ncbi:MAG: GntR family transcriptional regulator [Bacteroidales bacterium]|nr:GntR family transcriptional regulator [Bacteroidales bacterium]MCL2133462.1 GntR family transcriptional regulator [Bacteroidales bacterium]
MEFNSHKAIYLQIVDYICEKVLVKEWLAGSRIPSVRELGVSLEVNPNTVVRSYEHLETNGIIMNKRGVGFFLTENAVEKTVLLQQETFMTESLPLLFKNMYLLQISFEEMKAQYETFCKLNYPQL